MHPLYIVKDALSASITKALTLKYIVSVNQKRELCYTRFHKRKIHFNVTKCVENVQQMSAARETWVNGAGLAWVTPSQKRTGGPSSTPLLNSTKCVIYFQHLGPYLAHIIISMSTSYQSNPLTYHDWFPRSCRTLPQSWQLVWGSSWPECASAPPFDPCSSSSPSSGGEHLLGLDSSGTRHLPFKSIFGACVSKS